MQFDIDPEVRDLLPILEPGTLADLEQKLLAEGCLEKLRVGQYPGLARPILIDGHNRLAICEKHGLEFRIAYPLAFADRKALLQWVIDNQLSRRNLTPEQIRYYRGMDYILNKQPHGDPKRFKNTENSPSLHFANLGAVAEKYGVHPTTLIRNAEFAASVDAIDDPDERAAILSGTAKVKPKHRAKPPREFLTYEGRFDRILLNMQALSQSITEAMHTPHGAKLTQYLTMFKLVVYGNLLMVNGESRTNAPKFRGFPGLRRVIKLASFPGEARTEEEVRAEYARQDQKEKE